MILWSVGPPMNSKVANPPDSRYTWEKGAAADTASRRWNFTCILVRCFNIKTPVHRSELKINTDHLFHFQLVVLRKLLMWSYWCSIGLVHLAIKFIDNSSCLCIKTYRSLIKCRHRFRCCYSYRFRPDTCPADPPVQHRYSWSDESQLWR